MAESNQKNLQTITQPSPFLSERRVDHWVVGQTISDIVYNLFNRVPAEGELIVLINDWPVPYRFWGDVYPHADTLIVIKVRPQGGELGRSAALLAVTAGALAAFGPFGPGGASAIGGLTGWQAWAAVAASQAVGMLAINALIPLPEPKSEKSDRSPALSITGAKNEVRPWAPVPQVLGKYRFTPPYGALPYVDNLSGTASLVNLFTLGYGPVYVDESTLKLGDTPLSSYTGVEYEINQGFEDDEPFTIYTGVQTQDQINRRIYQGTCPDCTNGYDPGLPPYVYDEVITNVTSFVVDISFPNGIIKIQNQGTRTSITIELAVSWAETGSPTFEDDMTANERTFQVTGKTSTLIRHAYRIDLPVDPPPPSYPYPSITVRMRRISVDNAEGLDADGDTQYSASWWSVLTTIDATATPILTRPGECPAAIALRIQASDQLNGYIEDLNVEVTTIALDYNGGDPLTDWTRRPTNNPASLFRYILQGRANRYPVSDERIDLVALAQFHNWCANQHPDNPGVEQFTFNQIRDFNGTVFDALRDCAAAGRGRPVLKDGIWSVVWDDRNKYANPVQLFTPRNAWNISATKQMIDLPHAFRLRFVDSSKFYEQREVIVYGWDDSGTLYDETTATRYEQIDFPGLTVAQEAIRMAQYNLKVAWTRQERFQWNADIEHIVCQHGDAVLLQFDSIGNALGSAIVKSVATNRITLDSEFDTSKITGTLSMLHREAISGETHNEPVTAVGGPITAVFDYPAATPVPVPGDLAIIGELDQETIKLVIESIVPGADLSAQLTGYYWDIEDYPKP